MRGYRLAIPLSVALSFCDWRAGTGYLVGYTLHRWIDNDWDLMSANSAEGRMVNEVPLLGHFLYGVSSTYGSIFRRHHRSWITHWPIISTLVRLIFVFWLPFVLGDLYGINFIGDGWIWFWLSILAGLSHADTIHLYHDMRSTRI